MKREKDFFECFTATENDYGSSFCHHAFYKDGYVVATDSIILVRVPYNSLKGIYDKVDIPKKLPNFPTPNCSLNLPLSVLVDTIKSIPAEEVVPVEGVAAKCDECEGTGFVEWTYEDCEGKEHLENFDCPICNGRGRVKTKKYRREWRCISLNGTIFSVRPLMKLAKAMDIAGLHSVKVKNLSQGPVPALMCLDGGIDVIIMPCPDAKPIRKIKL